MNNPEISNDIPQEQILEAEIPQEQVVESAPVEIPVEAAPVEAPAPVEEAAPVEAVPAKPVKPAGKMKYIFKLAPAGKKVIAILGMVLALLAAGLLIFSYKTTMESPIMEIPFWSFSASLAEQEYDLNDLQDDMKDNAVDLQDWFEDNQARLEVRYDSESVALLKNYLNAQIGIGECFSIKNYQDYLKYYNQLVEDPISNELDFDIRYVGGVNEMETVGKVWDAISMVILVMAVICAALVFFGGMFRITALVCVAVGISMLYNLIFCGVVMLGICLALQVALIVFSSIVNKGYKNYRREVLAAA